VHRAVLGGLYGKQHKDDLAISELKKALQYKPDYEMARKLLGTIYLHKGKLKEYNELIGKTDFDSAKAHPEDGTFSYGEPSPLVTKADEHQYHDDL